MNCPKCNTPNPDGQKFCGNCGTELPNEEKVSSPSNDNTFSYQGNKQSPQPKKKKHGCLIAIIVVVVLFIGIGILFGSGNSNDSGNSESGNKKETTESEKKEYVDDIENFMADLNDDNFHACIASGGGRMQITMDRYEADWSMVERGWKIHVMGEGRQFASATEAIETYRKETGVVDQDLPGFVIAKDGQPVGTIDDGDSVVLFNFRGDRAQEISLAFDGDESFDKFDRVKVPQVKFAGMLQYDADLQIPKNYLTEPPKIKYTLTEELCKHGVREYAISETQKYGHVTYFWNGNRSEKFSDELEVWEEVPSDVIPFDQKPWMKATEVTEKMVDAIASGKYQFI